MRPTPSWAFAAAGLAAVAAYLALPAGGLGEAGVLLGLMSAAIGLLARAVLRLPRARQGPWRVLLAGQAVYALATFAWYLLPVAWGTELGYPSVVDGAFFLAYTLFSAFLLLLLGRMVDDSAGRMTLEALVAGVAAASLVQVLLVEPVVASSSAFSAAAAASIAYPVFMVVLVVLGLRLSFGGLLVSAPGLLLAGWLGAELVADLGYAHASLEGSFHYGHPMVSWWMLSHVALGALALHPRFPELSAGPSRPAVPKRRLLILGAALAVPLAVLVLDEHSPASWQRGTRAAWVALGAAFVLARVRGLVQDVALERRLRADVERLAGELAHAATHDPLTGLTNRSAFEGALARALARRRGTGRSAALLVVDLDAFKAINDTYGHPVGDDLLRTVAGRLRGTVRDADVVARLGGDEFAVVVDDVDVRAALLLAERLVAALAEPLELADVGIVPGASIGLHVPEPGEDPRGVQLSADAALYAAKAAGGGFQLSDPARHRRFVDRYQLELEMRAGVAREDEFVLHYQPVVDLATRRVVGAEALVRWNHPTRGLLAPGAFIQVAEESGAIVEVGRGVLRQACADARAWQDRVPGAEQVGVAVNASRRQLASPALADDVSEALLASGLPAGSLTLEITETALMSDTDEVLGVLHKLKALGVELAMDDFGTGYSSLAQLRVLPIDVLKIDKAFVGGIAREEEEWALAAAIVRLAASLDKRTLAEGVEHPSQLAHLRALGCGLAQGYLFSAPLALPDFEALLVPGTVKSPAPPDGPGGSSPAPLPAFGGGRGGR